MKFDWTTAFQPQLENQNFARYEIGGEISSKILVFILDYFQEKTMTEFFKKSGKLFCGAVLDPFGCVSFYLSWCRKSKKNQPIPEINAELTDRQTAGDFIGPSVGQEFKQSNLE